jgi:fermentation-respiration switch protein FrsA (DUF1100 family)
VDRAETARQARDWARVRTAVGYGLRLGGVALATSLVLMVSLLPLVMAHRAVHPVRTVGPATPATLGLAYEDVTFGGQDVELSGWYVAGRGQAGVVLIHGFAVDRRESLDLGPLLHAVGYDVLLYDQRASGRSGGDAVTFGYYEAGDLTAAVEWLRARSGVTRVGALGTSLGAAVALLAAGQGARLDAVIADSPFADLEQVGREDSARLYGPVYGTFSALLSPLMLWHAERMTGLRAAVVRPVAAMPHISPRPVLLIHGMEDRLFSYRHSEALYAAAGEPKELWLVPKAFHAGARIAQPAEYRRRVMSFFEAALARPADGEAS